MLRPTVHEQDVTEPCVYRATNSRISMVLEEECYAIVGKHLNIAEYNVLLLHRSPLNQYDGIWWKTYHLRHMGATLTTNALNLAVFIILSFIHAILSFFFVKYFTFLRSISDSFMVSLVPFRTCFKSTCHIQSSWHIYIHTWVLLVI